MRSYLLTDASVYATWPPGIAGLRRFFCNPWEVIVGRRRKTCRLSLRIDLAMMLSLVTLNAGCMILDQESYPESWSPVVINVGECADISGIYQNGGEGSDGVHFCSECDYQPKPSQCYSDCIDSAVRHLSGVFFTTKLSDNGSISIGKPDEGKLRINFASRDQSSESRTLSRDAGDYMCEAGKIWVDVATRMETDVGAVIVVSRKVGFGKAEDGSLVGEYHEKGRGVIFIGVPAYGSIRQYIRWQAANSESHRSNIK